MFSERDHFWMQQALELAKKAATLNEVPVGAVLVYQDKMIGEGFNRPIMDCDPSAHAEIIALRQGALTQNNYRLVDTTLYVTLEPCLMCVGAIQHARAARVVFGAFDNRTVDSVAFNHKVDYQGGLLATECAHELSTFFIKKRAKCGVD